MFAVGETTNNGEPPMCAAYRTVAATLFLVLTTPLGYAHDAGSGWSYPWECCSSMDCWEVGMGGPEPDPIPSPGGWKLSDGAVVPFHLARSSPDGRFHVCRRGGQLIRSPAD